MAGSLQLDDGLKRSVKFWSQAGPIYAHYRLTERLVKGKPVEERDAAFEALHNKYAAASKAIILSLRGFYIKIGQMGATRADFVPQQYIEQLETLQVSEPVSFRLISRIKCRLRTSPT